MIKKLAISGLILVVVGFLMCIFSSDRSFTQGVVLGFILIVVGFLIEVAVSLRLNKIF